MPEYVEIYNLNYIRICFGRILNEINGNLEIIISSK